MDDVRGDGAAPAGALAGRAVFPRPSAISAPGPPLALWWAPVGHWVADRAVGPSVTDTWTVGTAIVDYSPILSATQGPTGY
jgi:hypothetical protein